MVSTYIQVLFMRPKHITNERAKQVSDVFAEGITSLLEVDQHKKGRKEAWKQESKTSRKEENKKTQKLGNKKKRKQENNVTRKQGSKKAQKRKVRQAE